MTNDRGSLASLSLDELLERLNAVQEADPSAAGTADGTGRGP